MNKINVFLKLFIICLEELTETFNRYGQLTVDWPNKNENKSYCPPKGSSVKFA